MSRVERVRANLRRAYEAGRETVRARREEARRAAESGNGNSSFREMDEPPPPTPSDVHPSTASRDDVEVPRGLRIAAAWSWRLIVLGIVAWALIQVISRVHIVIIPLVIALLLSALLSPAVRWLLRLGLPRSLATAVVLIGGLAAVAGTLTLVITEFIDGLPQLSDSATQGIRQIQDWLQTGPLHLSDKQIDSYVDTAEKWLDDNTESLTSAGVSTATTLFEVLTGMFLVLFSTFFFLRDGGRIWRFMVRLLPLRARWQVDDAGRSGWLTLVAYVRATVLVAFIDAVGVGIAVWILGVPFPLPLAALVFLGAFIPIVGATLSGAVAVLIALVDRGWVSALILLGAVIAVQQLEGHVLQPLIMGRAVAIHPLAVIVSIAAGVVLAGIVGALVAVPLVAVLNTAVRRLGNPRRPEVPPDAVVVKATPP
ncbi:AI-2E family transporter [Phytohabitans sp. ZYX-F-186]|uniref:AI-2E family transporter n=1 Tax=Phytohabitans maris TaxID=3071409 RepID=A0ABU0ZI07_9ACTN|nr:AI-2E family transporter [Phytohabitans sp. ZYX-F-186]MDQ7906657.1 AI-2E family transporter [Phytohabitans sp. ZYX-F-186]